MGYVPAHIYIITGDERFKKDFDRQQKRDAIGIAVSGGISFLSIIGGGIYAILLIGG